MIYGVQSISGILKAWMRALVLFSEDVTCKRTQISHFFLYHFSATWVCWVPTANTNCWSREEAIEKNKTWKAEQVFIYLRVNY